MLSLLTALAAIPSVFALNDTRYSNETSTSNGDVFAPAERTFATVYIRITQSVVSATPSGSVSAAANSTIAYSSAIPSASSIAASSSSYVNAGALPAVDSLVKGAAVVAAAALLL